MIVGYNWLPVGQKGRTLNGKSKSGVFLGVVPGSDGDGAAGVESGGSRPLLPAGLSGEFEVAVAAEAGVEMSGGNFPFLPASLLDTHLLDGDEGHPEFVLVLSRLHWGLPLSSYLLAIVGTEAILLSDFLLNPSFLILLFLPALPVLNNYWFFLVETPRGADVQHSREHTLILLHPNGFLPCLLDVSALCGAAHDEVPHDHVQVG